MGLGPLDLVGLAEARERATDARRQRERGIDPIEARNAQRAQERLADAKVLTFDQCRDAYHAAHRAGWRSPKHAAQWLNSLAAHVSPRFGPLSVGAIDTGLVMQVLQPIWNEKPETASRVRGRIESILDWAKVNGHREGENPARWRGHLDHLLPARAKVQKVVHFAALPYNDMSAFMGELAGRDGIAALALRFAILTAGRTGEVLGAKWSEIDLQGRLWIIPGERMKGGRDHRVPLSDDAMAILEPLHRARTGDHVFPGGRRTRLSGMALLMLLRRMNRAELTIHGFRSSFRDWAAERTNFRGEIVEAALAHAVGGKVEAAYRRGDMLEHRRRLMEAWAAHCAQRPTELAGDTVISMKRLPA